jgi:hypothetical protein
VDGQPPGSAFAADDQPHEMRIEAWSSGAVTGGLARVEILRDGRPVQRLAPGDPFGAFRTNLSIRANQGSWYCVRAFGGNEQRQRAISGAFFFDERPWQPPRPVRAKVQVRVTDARSGRALDATLTEVSYLGAEPQPGAGGAALPGGLGVVTIPATARLRASAVGYEPLTLSPFFDHPALIEMITRLEDKDLLDWRTFERIRDLLGEVTLTFRLEVARSR